MKRFDLVDIIRELVKKKKFILFFTLASLVLGTVWTLLQKDRFTSRTMFIVKGMATMDRNQAFRQTSFPNKDFFASQDEVDYIVMIAESDYLRGYIAEKFNMAAAYGYTDPGKVSKRIKKNLKITRNDTKNIDLYFTDEDPQRAQAICQAATDWIEMTYRKFFVESNTDMVTALQAKVTGMDSLLAQLDDSIRTVRQQHGLYSQLLPTRGESLNAAVANASAEQAAAMEQLQRITSAKDQVLEDRGTFRSLINEYAVGLNGEQINLFYRVQQADVPNERSFPNMPLSLAICLVAGFFFACILVVLQASFQMIVKAP